MDGDDFASPELEDSEETETTNVGGYHNGNHSGSQHLNRDEAHEAAREADIEGEEEIEEKIDEGEVEEGATQQQQQQQEEEEEEGGEEEEKEEEEEEVGKEGDEAVGRKSVTTVETDREVAVGHETESNHNDADSAERCSPATVLNRKEMETSKSGSAPNLFPQRRSEDPGLSGYLDALFLLFVWTLGL